MGSLRAWHKDYIRPQMRLDIGSSSWDIVDETLLIDSLKSQKHSIWIRSKGIDSATDGLGERGMMPLSKQSKWTLPGYAGYSVVEAEADTGN
jgi:hypothetical protein